MPEIKIMYKTWTVPDYRNGETEKDSRLKKLELESDTLDAKRFSVDMEDEEVLTALKTIQNVVASAIRAEEKRLNNKELV